MKDPKIKKPEEDIQDYMDNDFEEDNPKKREWDYWKDLYEDIS